MMDVSQLTVKMQTYVNGICRGMLEHVTWDRFKIQLDRGLKVS